METLHKMLGGRYDVKAVTDEGANHYSVTAFRKMNSFRKKGKLCDVVIKAEGREFLAHRVVLAASSDYFNAMFSSGMAESAQLEIELKSISPEIMDALLDYVYTGQVRVSMDNVQDLLPAASLVQMEVDSTNVLGIRRFAELHNCTELEEFTENYAVSNFESVVESEEFMCLTHEELFDLVIREDLQIDSEESVYNAVMRWVYHQPTERVANLFPLLRNIRLSVMSVRFLTDVVDKDPLIRQSLECRDLVDDAKRYHLRPDLRHEMRDWRFCQRDGGNEYLVVIGGFGSDQDPSDSVEMFNPRTLDWSELPDLPGSYRYVAACSLGTCMYVIGGFDGSERLNTVCFLDIAQREEGWRSITPMHYKRSLSAACTNKGLIYVCGGFDGQSRLRSLEVYHPKIHEWRILEEMTTAREGAGLVVFDDTLYCLGGYDGFHLLNSMESFDLHSGTWSVCKPMYMRRSGAGCALLGETIYVCGGYGGAESRGPLHLDTVEAYNTRLAQWTLITSMNVPRCYVGACPLAGKIYVAAGYNGNRLLDTVESYDPIENAWCLHEESRMNHERCDTGMCVVRLPVCCLNQDTPTTVTTSRSFLNCSGVQSTLSTVSSVSVNPHPTLNQSTTTTRHSNDANVNRISTMPMVPQASVGYANPFTFQDVSLEGIPSHPSSRTVLSSMNAETIHNASQSSNPSSSGNMCVVNSQPPRNSHPSSSCSRSSRHDQNQSSRQNILSSAAAVGGIDMRTSKFPKHSLSLTASTLFRRNINVWNPTSMRFPNISRGLRISRNHRSLGKPLMCDPHNTLHSTPIPNVSEQVDNPLFNHIDTLHHPLDNIASTIEENYDIQNIESTANSEVTTPQETHYAVNECGNIDINEFCSHANTTHFDQPSVLSTQLLGSERSSCSSPTLVSGTRHSAPECTSSSSCKHELFRSVGAINRLSSDNIFRPISNPSAFSTVENPYVYSSSQTTTPGDDPVSLHDHTALTEAQGDAILVDNTTEVVRNVDYTANVGLDSNSPDEHDTLTTFGDLTGENGDLSNFSTRPNRKLHNFLGNLTTDSKELRPNSCIVSSNDSTSLPSDIGLPIHPTTSFPIPVAKVRPCSSAVTESACITTLNNFPRTVQNIPVQHLTDLSPCRNKQTFDTVCRWYRPVIPHSRNTDVMCAFRYNLDNYQTQAVHQGDRVTVSINDQKLPSSFCEMNNPREHSMQEVSHTFVSGEASQSHLSSDDSNAKNLCDGPVHLGASVKPDVTCTTSVVEFLHLPDTPGCIVPSINDSAIDQPQNFNSTSNCEPDITLCTVVYSSSGLNGNQETQPDMRSDGEGEEGNDSDTAQRNPAVGQVDDDS
ncbi:unnamed protein product [Heterobilharzia americana]|nr:unnamed protein product [Heterobilharzia americana]